MKAVITVLGKDKPGIIYHVSHILFQSNINILDISQTTMGDIFTMIMLVDISQSSTTLDNLIQQFKVLEKEEHLSISTQHEDIFSSMHRI